MTVVVVGSINVDLVVRAASLPTAGETVGDGAFEQHFGGKGANQAVAAARMGASVVLVGAVGDDQNGRAALADLAAEGVDVSRVRVGPGVATGVALIVVGGHGENQIAVAPGANARVDAKLVDSALADYRRSQGVFVASFELGDEAVMAGARFCSGAGIPLLINPAPPRELLAELLELRPILLPNEHEARALTGEADPEAAARLLTARTGAPMIVTLGARGALVMDRDSTEHIPAPATKVVDTTGAGDCFVGVLAAELDAGSSLHEAARVAVRAASQSVSAPGARAGMPHRANLG